MQVIGPDNLPSLVVASTTQVTIAATNLGQPTRVQVGGQSYTPAATLTLTTSGTGANGLDTGSLTAIGLYYVYMIVNASTLAPALVASLTGPSTGPSMPSGYGTAYKLVGAFYTNGSSQVGSMVSLTGPITTAWMNYVPVITGLGTGSTAYNNAEWRRVGDSVEVQFTFEKDTSAGSGGAAVNLTLPSGLTFNTASLSNGSASAQSLGFANYFQSSGNVSLNWSVFYSSSTTVAMILSTTANSVTGATIGLTSYTQGRFTVPISGWNATLL